MNNSVKHRILLTGASGTLGRNFLELAGNDPNLEILVLLLSESRFHSKISTATGCMPQVSREEGGIKDSGMGPRVRESMMPGNIAWRSKGYAAVIFRSFSLKLPKKLMLILMRRQLMLAHKYYELFLKKVIFCNKDSFCRNGVRHCFPCVSGACASSLISPEYFSISRLYV